MRNVITCVLALMGLTVACTEPEKYTNVDVKGFAELIADTDVVVLDVRTAEEYAEGHIEGALNIDQSKADFMYEAHVQLPMDQTVAVYCRGGRRSAKAARKLTADGFKVVNLEGGITAWKEAGMAVVPGEPEKQEKLKAPEPADLDAPSAPESSTTSLPSSGSSYSYSSSPSTQTDNMRGFDPAFEDDTEDNGMSRYMENNDEEGWE